MTMRNRTGRFNQDCSFAHFHNLYLNKSFTFYLGICIWKTYCKEIRCLKTISARLVPQILSMKGKCTFIFLSFLIIGLCKSSADSLFDIIFNYSTRRFFIKIFIGHWSKFTLISIIFRIFSDIRCITKQFLIRSCSAS